MKYKLIKKIYYKAQIMKIKKLKVKIRKIIDLICIYRNL